MHHGNGTEETIRWLSPGLETSEVVTPMGFGTLSAPRYKPWYGENDAGECDVLCIHVYMYTKTYCGIRSSFLPTCLCHCCKFINVVLALQVSSGLFNYLTLKHIHTPLSLTPTTPHIHTENVLFVSVHGYGPREEGMDHLMPACAFYPGSGRTVIPTVLPPSDGCEVCGLMFLYDEVFYLLCDSCQNVF